MRNLPKARAHTLLCLALAGCGGGGELLGSIHRLGEPSSKVDSGDETADDAEAGDDGAASDAGASPTRDAALKPRLILLLDIAPDNVQPDDAQSLIRLLVYADLFEIDGLIATEGWSEDTYPLAWADRIKTSIDAYEKDAPNLLERSKQNGYSADESRQNVGYWPSPDYLRSRFALGSVKKGYAALGEGNDSDGSNLIIKLADEDDERPLWVVTGGADNTLAQAIWRVQGQRTPAQIQAFLHKIRTFTVSDQDKPCCADNHNWAFSSHQWMRKQFGQDLFFIWDECAWTYQGKTGAKNWSDYATNVQNKGSLGKIYPKYKDTVEGDTPAFLHLIPIGLNDPDAPSQVGWGGYSVYAQSMDGQTSAYVNQPGTTANAICNKYEDYFYPATFNDFAARMDWAQDGAGNRNPLVVVNGDQSLDVMVMKPMQGTSVTLDASKSSDPDGDKLGFKWWILSEAGTYAGSIDIPNNNSDKVTIHVPADSAGKSFHMICEVTDNGAHALASYRRIIFEPTN